MKQIVKYKFLESQVAVKNNTIRFKISELCIVLKNKFKGKLHEKETLTLNVLNASGKEDFHTKPLKN